MAGDLLNLSQESETSDHDIAWADGPILSQTDFELLDSFNTEEEKPDLSEADSPVSGNLHEVDWEIENFNWREILQDNDTQFKSISSTDDSETGWLPDVKTEDANCAWPSCDGQVEIPLPAQNASPAPHQMTPPTREPPTIQLYPIQSVSPVIVQSPVSVQLITSSAPTVDVGDSTMAPLMGKYDLTDDSLTDLTVSSLQKKCRGRTGDFNRLKTYRRTCLNRQYARTSRSKRQVHSDTMQSQLETALAEVKTLQKRLADSEAENKHLKFENDLYRAVKMAID